MSGNLLHLHIQYDLSLRLLTFSVDGIIR